MPVWFVRCFDNWGALVPSREGVIKATSEEEAFTIAEKFKGTAMYHDLTPIDPSKGERLRDGYTEFLPSGGR
jgi:hypothetical protein